MRVPLIRILAPVRGVPSSESVTVPLIKDCADIFPVNMKRHTIASNKYLKRSSLVVSVFIVGSIMGCSMKCTKYSPFYGISSYVIYILVLTSPLPLSHGRGGRG